MQPTSFDLSRLRRDGIVPMGLLDEVDDAQSFLGGFETKPGHVRRATPQNSPDTLCYSMEAILQLPGLLRFALGMTDFAKRHLDAEPVLYSVNAFWTKPARNLHPGLQEFHRDKDDSRFFAMFIYGTDVLEPNDGPHEFVHYSHDGLPHAKDAVIPIYGPRMTWFLEDPRGLHRGRMPLTHERLLLWMRWGVSDPPMTYTKDGMSPVPRVNVPDYPSDPYLQNVIRLVAA